MPTILESRRTNLATQLSDITAEAADMMGRDDFDPDAPTYTALRENRQKVEGELRDVLATMDARTLAQGPAPAATVDGERVSDFRRVLREYDRGHSDRVDIPYTLRELQTNDPYLTPPPSRLQVPTLPTMTPSLDSVRQVQTSNSFDFVVPPPPVAASTVPEGGLKPTRTWVSTRVAGTLETDAHIIDVTRQTLEDDATAEATLRSWLVDGVKLRQDQKVAEAITGATGTLTATGPTLLAAVRGGKAELSTIGIPATTVYLHPDDAAAIDLEVMASANGLPSGQPTLWGMTVIENPGLTAGTAIVGSMPNAVYFLYRSAISTYLTDSGMTQETTPRDRFSHNLLGVLGEGRSTVRVVQPQLLVKCTVGAGTQAATSSARDKGDR